MASVQGAFYGVNLPAARIEALIAAHIPRKHINDVAASYGLKWWDYRRLTPGHCFYLFTESYYRATKIAARKFVRERNNLTTPGTAPKRSFHLMGAALVQMNVEDVWQRDQRHITGLWNAMLVADVLGIPYPEFCRIACSLAIKKKWDRLPRPHQLYSEAFAAEILIEWEALFVDRIFTATHPLYRVENYAGLQVQDEYRAWLISKMTALKTNPVPALLTAVYSHPQIPVEIAKLHFSDSLLNRVRLLSI